MIVLLAFLYFAYVSWLVIATYLNYVVAAWREDRYSVTNGVSLVYALMWVIALTAPVAYGEFLT